MYAILPECLERIELALQPSASAEDRADAADFCDTLRTGDTHGTLLEDVRRTVTYYYMQHPSLFANKMTRSAQKRIRFSVTHSCNG